MQRQRLLTAAAILGGCVGSAPVSGPGAQLAPALPPALPTLERGWGVPVLAVAGNPALGFWAGTHGEGLWVLRDPEGEWQRVTGPGGPPEDAIVNAVAVSGDVVWYGTAGGGFGRSEDRGETWHVWTAQQLGGGWAHVTPEGIAARRDTAWIATLNGLRVTTDGGQSWLCIGQADQPPSEEGGCTEVEQALPTKYLLTLAVGADRRIWVGHLSGISVSQDGGRHWRNLGPESGVPSTRIRHIATAGDTLSRVVWVATETAILVDSTAEGRFKEAPIRVPGFPSGLPGSPRSIVPAPGLSQTGPSILMTRGMASGTGGGAYRTYYLAASDRYAPAGDMWAMSWWGPPLWPIAGSSVGLARVLGGQVPERVEALREPPMTVARPVEPARPWLDSPIGESANPYADAIDAFGLQTTNGPREFVAYNNPAGTPVLAVAAGEVIEVGSGRVVVRLDAPAHGRTLFCVFRGVEPGVTVGSRVATGQTVGRVSAGSDRQLDRLELELRLGAEGAAGLSGSTALNPHLWIRPSPRTGVVLGQVVDEAGQPVPGAVIRGFVLAYPEETPFGGLSTYANGVAGDPVHSENFAIGGVPAGDYLVGVDVGGTTVFQRAVVREGWLTVLRIAP